MTTFAKSACEYNPNLIQNLAITPVCTLHVAALFQGRGRVIGYKLEGAAECRVT